MDWTSIEKKWKAMALKMQSTSSFATTPHDFIRSDLREADARRAGPPEPPVQPRSRANDEAM